MKQINTLIIGLGDISVKYDLDTNPAEFCKTHARAIHLSNFFNLSAGVDPKETNRNTFEGVYRKPTYKSLNEVLEVDLDFIIIANPTDQHYKTLKEVVSQFKPKIILCEKVLSDNLDESREMVDLCKSKKIQLFVNYTRRSDPGVIKIKQMIDSKIINSPVRGFCFYTKGYFHNASHFFNLFEFWLGKYKNSKLISSLGSLKKDPEIDISINFKKGNILFISLEKKDYTYSAINILSTTGRLNYDYGGNEISWIPFSNSNQTKSINMIANDLKKYQFNVLKEIQNVFEGKAFNLCNADQALLTIENMHKSIL